MSTEREDGAYRRLLRIPLSDKQRGFLLSSLDELRSANVEKRSSTPILERMPDSLVTRVEAIVLEETQKSRVCLNHLYILALPDTSCLGCGVKTSNLFTARGVRKFCSHRCLNTSEAAWDLRKATTRKRFGSDNVFGSEWFVSNREDIYMNALGVTAPMRSPEVRAKVRSSNFDRYGVLSHLQSEEVKSSIRKTNLRKYGVPNVMQNQKIRERLKESVRNKYGVDCVLSSPEVQASCRRTMLHRHGVENPFFDQAHLVTPKILSKFGVTNMASTQHVKDKIRRVFKKNYGGHPAQNPEWMDANRKTGYPHRVWRSSSGEEFAIQGYEDVVLTDLDYHGWEVKTSKADMPDLWWKSSNGSRRRYYPDILAKKGDRKILIEVKSTWTLYGTQYGKSLDSNLRKLRSASSWCRKNDADLYLVVVVNGRMRRLKNPTRKSVLSLVNDLKSK